jgi:uncharacterized protein YdhG (YjbR/CyaY superfamily)
MKDKLESVDEYIRAFPKNVQKILEQVRKTIIEKAPEAVESISYGMPGYKTHGRPLVYFAAFEKHIGFYATPAGHEAFAADLSKFKQGKGSVQFPIDQPIPFELIARITEFRVKENAARIK